MCIILHIFFQTCAVLYPCVSPRSCHHVSQPVFLKSMKPASWLIRAGIQPPRLHLTISHRATYSIISCLTWRVLLSLTQADRKFPFISCTKLAGCSQTKRNIIHYDCSRWGEVYKLGSFAPTAENRKPVCFLLF